MRQTTQSWSIIIFCYNEAGALASVIESVQRFFRNVHCSDNEIIIVDDGSTDNCGEIVCKVVANSSNVRAVRHSRNLGIGHALRSGYEAAQYENISAIPADGQFDTAELVPYANLAEDTFVSFYRNQNIIYSRGRSFLSLVNRKVNSILLGIKLRDVNWVKIYKRGQLKTLDLRLKSSLVESEICAKLLLQENRVIETASTYHPRKTGHSKGGSSGIVLQAARETLKLLCVVNLYRVKRNWKQLKYRNA